MGPKVIFKKLMISTYLNGIKLPRNKRRYKKGQRVILKKNDTFNTFKWNKIAMK